MVSVSEWFAGSPAEKHREPAINGRTASLRQRKNGAEPPAPHLSLADPPAAAAITPADAAGVMTLPDAPVGGWMKRGFDITIAATTLLLMLPIFLMLTGMIYLSMGRPIFFAQQRVGFRGRSFACYKFRSMVTDADERLARHLREDPEAARRWAATQKLADDPRITLLGRILRKSSLDELPQLFNILRGDMSCIGPRPVLARELACHYGASAKAYMSAKPGLSGMWQVSGRSTTSYRRRIACDRFYVSRWSMLLDLKILYRTIPAVLKTDQTS
ncbi:MAG: sugar transferase [Rhodomicrobiaceae bacterium]